MNIITVAIVVACSIPALLPTALYFLATTYGWI